MTPPGATASSPSAPRSGFLSATLELIPCLGDAVACMLMPLQLLGMVVAVGAAIYEILQITQQPDGDPLRRQAPPGTTRHSLRWGCRGGSYRWPELGSAPLPGLVRPRRAGGGGGPKAFS